MTNHGGARPGAGRPQRRYPRGQEPTGETPIEKLWAWLDERIGAEITEEAHLYFNEQKRVYEKQRREAMLERRKSAQAWWSNEINTATDLMDEDHIDITPESLSQYVAKHWGELFTLTTEEATEWLDKQDWYKNS